MSLSHSQVSHRAQQPSPSAAELCLISSLPPEAHGCTVSWRCGVDRANEARDDARQLSSSSSRSAMRLELN